MLFITRLMTQIQIKR